MTQSVLSSWRALVTVLAAPLEAQRAAIQGQRPLVTAAGLGAALVVLGTATIPRQVALLDGALALTGNAMLDAQQAVLRGGVLRLIVADRLVPSATLLLGAVFLVVAAEPVLALARDRRGAIWAIVLLGLSPLLVDRLGQLAMTYLVPFAAHVTPGDAVAAPHRFSTGPLILWQRSELAPAWLELLDDRANLISAWCIALWSVGLRQLDGGRLALWHVALPVGCVVAAGLVTWVVGPLVLAAILSGG